MKVLVFGAKGFIGSSLLAARSDWIGSQADIAHAGSVAEELQRHQPEAVVNCAGKSGIPNIDWCESHKLETTRSNISGPLVLLDECLKRNVFLVQLSSGCVYQGDNYGRGMSESDLPNFSGSFYSRSKIAAEVVLADFPVLILRLRMPFCGWEHPRNLICRLRRYQRVLDAPNSMSYLPDFIRAAISLIERHAIGIYHVANLGSISPYDIMVRYKRIVDPEHRFERLTPEQLPEVAAAGRSNCILSTVKLQDAGVVLQPVDSAIDDALLSLRDQASIAPWQTR